MSHADIDRIRRHGVSMRWPAGQFERFTREAADSLVGTTTQMDAHEFGIDETWRMKIIRATIVCDGAALDVTLAPVDRDDV